MTAWKPTPEEFKAMQMRIEPLFFVAMKLVGGRAAICDSKNEGETLQFVTSFDLDRLFLTAKGWDEHVQALRRKANDP